ncbi:hypothetical protein O0I10_013062 [Lichtheimia ornata]|uniref:Uncharacterized protein n=1 Tax=Lichtheimia ornata TaxID=688661 RepID=A0AAD7XSJ2_9FUNG|nr:uncharacterized protein O0I10_013062 [Lichtheimia ornata]KAJ8651398.1 hypothetical protein O0I10_013062 [Lichtheimia ornata]
MSALEGDAVTNTSSAVDLFKPSKQVTSTPRSPPKLLQGMAMHKAMQHVYGLPSQKPTTTARTSLALSSSPPASASLASSSSSSSSSSSALASTSSASASSSSSASSASSSLDELCEALEKLDIYEPDTDVPDALPGTPEQLREIVENEDADASEQAPVIEDMQDTTMASPSPSPPSVPLPLPLPPPPPPPPQEPPIMYTQVVPQPITIHPEATPEVVVAAVVAAAASPAPAASAIPVASSTGSSNNRSRLEIRRPVIRPRSRLRWHRQSGNPPPPLPRPPPSPPRPPIPSSPPPQPPTPPASTSSAMKQEDRARPIACPKRRVKRPELVSPPPPPSSSTALPSSSSRIPSPIPPSIPSSIPPSIPSSIPSSSSSTLPSSEAEPAPPSSILVEYAEQADSFMGGDDILAEIIGTDFDPYDVAVFNEDV